MENKGYGGKECIIIEIETTSCLKSQIKKYLTQRIVCERRNSGLELMIQTTAGIKMNYYRHYQLFLHKKILFAEQTFFYIWF